MTLRSQKSVVFVGTLSFFLTLTFTFFLSLSSASASTISRPMFHDGLVGYWDFDVGKGGGTVYDRSGFGSHGTMTNMDPASDWVNGKIGGGMDFDRVDDSVRISDSPVFNVSIITVSAWVKHDSNFVFGNGIVSHADSGAATNGWWFTLRGSANGSRLQFTFADTDYFSPNNSMLTAEDIWTHVSVTFDGQAVKFYRDGSLLSESASALSITNSSDPLKIGEEWNFYGTDLFGGSLDDVRIYNRALSASEVSHLYKIGRPTIKRALLDDGLVGYWNFDVGKGGSIVYDMSGFDNHATLSTTTDISRVWTNGKVGGAIDFDGNDDFADVGGVELLRIRGDLTLSAWFRADTFSNQDKIITTRLPGETNAVNTLYEFVFNTTSGNDIGYCHETTGAANVCVVYDVNLTAGTWYSAVIVRDTTEKTVALYLNNTLVSKNTYSGDPIDGSTSKTVIGADSGFMEHFDGIIDEVRVYNRALSAGEVSRLYRMTRPKINVTRTTGSLGDGLVGHWSFDGKDVYNTFIKDVSGNGNDGTDSGGSTPTIGKVGQGRKFDGVDDYVNIGNIAADVNKNEGSISIWIKTSGLSYTTFADNGAVIGVGQATAADGIGLLPDSSSDLAMLYRADSSSRTAVITNFPTNSWSHVVGIWDTSAVEIYLNGEFITSTSQGTMISASLTTGRIAADILGTLQSNFIGELDDARLYNRALSVDEVKRLYNLGR